MDVQDGSHDEAELPNRADENAPSPPVASSLVVIFSVPPFVMTHMHTPDKRLLARLSETAQRLRVPVGEKARRSTSATLNIK